MRKVVSYFKIWGRKVNRIFHRAAQVVLMTLPSWAIWSLSDAPRQLRRNSDRLLYRKENKRVCICCGGPKKPGTTTTMDAGQAYEQTELSDAVKDLIFAAAWAWATTDENHVSVFREFPASSKMGGHPSSLLDFRSPVVCSLWLRSANIYASF